jgi:hypothetical protein
VPADGAGTGGCGGFFISGFSAKNLRYCRAFFSFYSDIAIWQQPVAKLGESDAWPNTADSQLMQTVAQLICAIATF